MERLIVDVVVEGSSALDSSPPVISSLLALDIGKPAQDTRVFTVRIRPPR
ncbi:hypothetical protein [Sorangium sp. So ce1335]